MHLLKKLKVTLREANSETDGLQTEIRETLQDIRIASIRHQVRCFDAVFIGCGCDQNVRVQTEKKSLEEMFVSAKKPVVCKKSTMRNTSLAIAGCCEGSAHQVLECRVYDGRSHGSNSTIGSSR